MCIRIVQTGRFNSILFIYFFLTHKSLFTIFLEDNSILFPIFFFFFGQGELVQKQSRSSETWNVWTMIHSDYTSITGKHPQPSTYKTVHKHCVWRPSSLVIPNRNNTSMTARGTDGCYEWDRETGLFSVKQGKKRNGMINISKLMIISVITWMHKKHR